MEWGMVNKHLKFVIFCLKVSFFLSWNFLFYFLLPFSLKEFTWNSRQEYFKRKNGFVCLFSKKARKFLFKIKSTFFYWHLFLQKKNLIDQTFCTFFNDKLMMMKCIQSLANTNWPTTHTCFIYKYTIQIKENFVCSIQMHRENPDRWIDWNVQNSWCWGLINK